MSPETTVLRTAIVYHFFASYRQPLLEKLHRASGDEYVFLGDPVNRIMPGVPVWEPPADVNFVATRGYVLPGGFLIQPKVILLPFRKDIDTIIYLGDWKFLSTWVSALIARLFRKKILFWTHGWLVPEKGLKRHLRKLFYGLADGLLLYGNAARKIGEQEGFRSDRLYVVFNSLDVEKQKSIREQVKPAELEKIRCDLFENPEYPLLFLVGRIGESKRIDLLIEAVAQLASQNRHVNLLIVGDGSDRRNLETLAESKKLPVHFYGACHDDEVVGRLIMSADLTVCPSAAGLTVIHSLGFGVPVVTSDNMEIQGPEVEAIIPDVSGAFFEDGNVNSLVATITRLLFDRPPLDREVCCQVVEQFYNPAYQLQVFRRAIRLNPAIAVNLAETFSSSRSIDQPSNTHRKRT